MNIFILCRNILGILLHSTLAADIETEFVGNTDLSTVLK